MLPLVDVDTYRNNLEAWKSAGSKICDSQKSNETCMSEDSDEVLHRLAKIKSDFGFKSKETKSEDILLLPVITNEPILIEDEEPEIEAMSPLLFVSDSEEEIHGSLKPNPEEADLDIYTNFKKTDKIYDSFPATQHTNLLKANIEDDSNIHEVKENLKDASYKVIYQIKTINKSLKTTRSNKSKKQKVHDNTNEYCTRKQQSEANAKRQTRRSLPNSNEKKNVNIKTKNKISVDKLKAAKSQASKKIQEKEDEVRKIVYQKNLKQRQKDKVNDKVHQQSSMKSNATSDVSDMKKTSKIERSTIQVIEKSSRQTRSMQRITRSAGKQNKYLKQIVEFGIDKSNSKRLKQKEYAKRSLVPKNCNLQKTLHDSMVCNSDYEDIMECGQKLSQISKKSEDIYAINNFRTPLTPSIRLTQFSALLQSISTDNEIAIVNNQIKSDLITISSSESQQSLQNYSTKSRRTKVLKSKREKRTSKKLRNTKPNITEADQSTRENMTIAKSPDLFSNGSDVLPCTQQIESFKIFSTDLQQNITHNNCLTLEPITNLELTEASTKKRKKRIPMDKSAALLADEFFEITNNATFGNQMRLHSNGEVSPVTSQIRCSVQNNKITNYLINSKTESIESVLEPKEHTPTKPTTQLLSGTSIVSRKSPKYFKPSMQKLTKWFCKNDVQKNSQTHINESGDETDHASTSKRKTSGRSSIKRRRLELAFSK